MLRVHPVRGTQRAVDYYTSLAREQRSLEVDQPDTGRHESSGDYYLQSDDEGGTWYGQGRKALGLEGLGTREQLKALFEHQHPDTGEKLGQAPQEKSILAYDLTFSAPKSVSVLATLIGGKVEQKLVAAHDNAVKAVIDAIEERTTTRAGKGGVSRLDTSGLTVLMVRHRTSRLLDPQLHTHALLIGRVQGSDGRWRALDATHIFREQVSFGTIYQAVLRSEISRLYPHVRWGEVVRGQAEIAGTERMNAIFSRRTEQMQERLQRLLREWKVKHPGRRIAERERSQLERKAAKVSRPPKDRARQPQEIRAMARRTAAEHGFDDLGRIEREFLHPARTPELRSPSEQEIARAAIVALVSERSVWSFERVERQIAERIGQSTRRSASAQQRAIEGLARKAVQSFCVDLAVRDDDPEAARRLDREPALERYTTQPLMEVEQEVVRWFHEAASHDGHEATDARMRHARRALERESEREGREAPELDPEQHAAASLVAGTHEVSVAVGPAGTGKTTMLRLATIALEQDGCSAIALSPQSVSAAEAGEATRLAFGTVREYLVDREREESQRRFALRRGDTIILDEAGTMNTQDYHRLLSVCRSEGYRLALVGDPLQLSAVGRGGMMNHACEIVPAVELEKVHRFRERWEGDASLALRKARREALSVYERHGRIHSGDEEDVHERMLDRLVGRSPLRRDLRLLRPHAKAGAPPRRARAAAAHRGGRARHQPIVLHEARPADLRRRHRADPPQRAPAFTRAGGPRAKPRDVDGRRDRTRRLGHAQAQRHRAHPARPRPLCARADRARLLLDSPRSPGTDRSAWRHADRRARGLPLVLRRHDARSHREPRLRRGRRRSLGA